MALFRHQQNAPAPLQDIVPGLADVAARQGWQRAPAKPFDGHLEEGVHEISRCMYGAARQLGAVQLQGIQVGGTFFSDAYRGSVNGRTVIVANALTEIESQVRFAEERLHGVAVCAVELPGVLPVKSVETRQFPSVSRLLQTSTGNPAFDDRFTVIALAAGAGHVLTPDVQQRIMARDDWSFLAERYLLGCVSKGRFHSVDAVTQRISEVLDIVAAIPTSVLPSHVDHSQDALMSRISKLNSLEDAMALLQSLTPADREQLARSDTPLAVMADVRTPQEAMARFQSMDQPTKMQLMAMFMRVQDKQRGR